MKKNKSLVIASLLILGLCANVEATQMSGTYTINPSVAVSTTNFHNFYSAIAFLTGGTRNDSGANNISPFGVSGPVIFQVAAATYSEQINLTTTISGTSPVNTITFDGGNGNSSSRIVTYAATSTPPYATIVITNNPYLTLRNLTINNTGSSHGQGVIVSGTSNCCRVSKCNINLPISTSASFFAQ